ncbi:MAG TPA: hypothetical protein PKD90_08375, partial [Phnomibacter sp.]|nr:hypothetical protein [Phnomibacter sp.]
MQKANIAPRLSLAAAMLLLANTTLVHAQRVGIGTENPETDLHIRGGSNARLLIQNISGIGSSEVEIKSSNTVNQSLRIVHFNTNNAGTIAGIALSGATSMLTGVNAAGGLLLGTQSNVPLYWLTNNQRRLTLTEGGQLAIGGTAPHPSAILDVQGNAGGLLIPRVTTAQRNAIAAPADGLLVYNQSTSNLNLFKQGTGWAEMSTSSGDAWLTTGNFTAPAGAQLGTWNGEPLRFRVFDRNAGMLGFDAEANAFMGYASGNHTQATQANTAFGTSSLSSLTSGQRNTAVGTEAGFGITTGSRNVLVGRQAGWQSTTQNNLVAIGAQALYHAKGNDH